MSRGNVDIVRHAFDALNRGAIDEMFEAAADDLVMDWSNSISPLKGVYRGRESGRRFVASFVDAFESVSWDPLEFIEIDDATLVVVNHVRMRGRASGVEVEVTGAHLWTFRDGQATSIKLFQTKHDALDAA